MHVPLIFQIVAIEGACAAVFGAPVVGFLAEHSFGYVQNHMRASDLPVEVAATNARALGVSLLFLTVVPWIGSFVLYTCLHFTYGRDREKLRVRIEWSKLQCRG